VIDAAITLSIISGKDINDKTTYELEEKQIPNYLALLDEKYGEALKNSINYGKEIDVVMNENNLDVLVFVNTSGADIAAKVGYPSVTIPAGYTKSNKPVGLTFTSIGFTEEKLLSYAYAYAYECAYNKRKNPQSRGILSEEE
jgi:Asp-tRNA(Asn)/Glu-tRNA(Gln) amidotransferase A subunit family amidase